VIVEPVHEGRILRVSLERRTNRQPGLRCAAKDREAPTTQRSMFFNRSLRSAAAMNSEGSTSLPCVSTMRNEDIEHSGVVALQAGDRLFVRSRKRFSISAALMCLTHTLSYDCTRVSASALSDVTDWLPPRVRPLMQASRASAIAASNFTSPEGTAENPTVQVTVTVLSLMRKTCF